jgi:5-methylcytosine-specific restriction enzyme subunit McrC
LSIPIQNLYFLLVYAWDMLHEAGAIDVGASDARIPEDLFAKILRNGIRHLLKRGLDRSYTSETSDIPGVRGKLEISATIKRKGKGDGRAVCTFDELTHDVLHNQLLKATLLRLVRAERIDNELRRDLSDLLRRFDSVRAIPLRNEAFRQVQLHSNNRFYRLLLQVCLIIYRQLLPEPTGAAYRFVEFSQEQLDVIFQAFVRNYFAHHQSSYRVSSERFRWQRIVADESAWAHLPTMLSDVSMESPTRKLVIETKFYGVTLSRHFRSEDKDRINSAHLNQIFAYLQNLAARDSRAVDGLLLYAQAEREFCVDIGMFGHNLRVATVNLASSPEDIGSRLFACAKVEWPDTVPARRIFPD